MLAILFFFFSLSSPLKIYIRHLKFQSCPFIYWYFNFDSYFFFLIFVLGSFVKFWFIFNFIFQSQFMMICYFFQFELYSFDFFSLFCYIDSSFQFHLSIKNLYLLSNFFFNSNLIIILLLLFFWILLYNWIYIF